MNRPLSQRAVVALKRSIAHWERMASGADEVPNAESCALCTLYIKNGCKACPIAQHTGQMRCGGTPYNAAYYAFLHREGFRTAAQAEVNFLRTLLVAHAARVAA